MTDPPSTDRATETPVESADAVLADVSVETPPPNDVIVVPASTAAWELYQKHHAYLCDTDRKYRPLPHVAFYSTKHVQTLVPKVLEVHECVVFERDKYEGQLGELVNQLLDYGFGGPVKKGQEKKVFLLTSPESDDTVKLDERIKNDLKNRKGKTLAFAKNQRYVALERLRAAKLTSELVAGHNTSGDQQRIAIADELSTDELNADGVSTGDLGAGDVGAGQVNAEGVSIEESKADDSTPLIEASPSSPEPSNG